VSQPKTLQEYMVEIQKNKELIDSQQKIITNQISQGENVLKTLRASLSLESPQAVVPSAQKPAVLPSGQAPAVVPSAQQGMNPTETTMTTKPKLSNIEEEERKKRKEGNWMSTPKMFKNDWEKKKREHDEKVKKATADIEAYEHFVADKSDEQINKLEAEYNSTFRSISQPEGYKEYKALKKAKIEADEFIKNDVIPRQEIDKRFAEQREARKKVLTNFENSLNSLNAQKKEISDKIKENIKNKQKYLTMSDEAKNNDSNYAKIIEEENKLKNEKLALDNDIKVLTENKDKDLKPIDTAITELKAEAKKKEIGGKKTRKRRTKNLKRRQSRKYRNV
jgi:hypothetical protein